MGALRGVLGLLTLVSCIVGVSIAVLCADEYREALNKHRIRYEQASVYIKISQHCKNRVSRLKLAGFHMCDEAEEVLRGPPSVWLALVDVANTLPPIFMGFVGAVRADLLKILMTLGGVAIVGSVVRRWTSPGHQPSPFMLPTSFVNQAYRPYASPGSSVVWGNPNSVRVVDY